MTLLTSGKALRVCGFCEPLRVWTALLRRGWNGLARTLTLREAAVYKATRWRVLMNRQYLSWYILLAVIALIGSLIPLLMSRNVGASPIIFALTFAVVFPPALIWLLQKLGYPIGRAISCPRCGTELAPLRKPTSLRQAAWGGFTCPKCGAELDRSGKEISAR
jgi:hypothetical protein